MTKKLKGKTKSAGATKIAGPVMDSAHQIWLAGLGAFAMAQEEGGKLFDSLVKEGEKLEKRTRQAAEDTVSSVKDRVADVKDTAGEGTARLEQVFEQRVADALNRLGVPTVDDIAGLSQRVEELNKSLKELAQAKGRKG